MKVHEVRSIEIAGTYEEVFDFIAERNNLPRWTNAFESVDATRARMRTPEGSVEVDLEVCVARNAGTIDWFITFPDRSVATAFSRVTPATGSRVVYSFVLNAPPVPLEHLEGTLSQQANILESELAHLAQRFEA